MYISGKWLHHLCKSYRLFAISDFFCAPELILFLSMSKSQKHSKASFLKKESSLKCVFFS